VHTGKKIHRRERLRAASESGAEWNLLREHEAGGTKPKNKFEETLVRHGKTDDLNWWAKTKNEQ
jgi:hypothetical protein